MSVTDAPDWQEVVTTVASTGSVPDSPDWQNTVVGPAGVPVMTNPMTTKGDIIVGGTSGAPARLAIGTGTQFLGITSGTPAWKAVGGGGGGNLTALTPTVGTAPAGLPAFTTVTANSGSNLVEIGGTTPVTVSSGTTLTSGTAVVVVIYVAKLTKESGTVNTVQFSLEDNSSFQYQPWMNVADTGSVWPIYNLNITYLVTLSESTTALTLLCRGVGGGVIGFDNTNASGSGSIDAVTVAMSGYYV
jgi:hypothetical protein